MVQIVFITPEGEAVAINAPIGTSVMEAAKANDVPGIEADCGGSMVCGTCHVVVDPKWHEKLPEQDAMEAALLEYVPEPHSNTRLTCQIPVTESLAGIMFRIPKLQR